MWHANEKKSAECNCPADYEGKRCGEVSYSTGKLGTNFSAFGKRRVDLQVGIDYGADVAKAIKVALEAISKVPGVLQDPAPSVSVAKLAESEVTLNVRPWSAGGDYWTVYSACYQAVMKAFDENKIDIPFNQLVVHMDK